MRLGSARIPAAVAALALAAAAVPPAAAGSLPQSGGCGDGPPQEAPRFTAATDLVTVAVVVRDRRGRPIRGLSREDFVVLDSGEPAAIAAFRDEPAPVSVALLIDQSGSMHLSSKTSAARDAVVLLSAALEAGKDEAALFAFDVRLQELRPFSTETADLSSQLPTLRPFGSTSLYDAIAETGRRLVARGGPRRAVVAITDGLDTSSALTASDVSGLASSIDVPVYVLAVTSPVEHQRRTDEVETPPAQNRLENLSRWTGGRVFLASTPAQAAAAAAQIVGELRHQYLLAIPAGDRPGWHPLAVRTGDPDHDVRARGGYIVPSVPSSSPQCQPQC